MCMAALQPQQSESESVGFDAMAKCGRLKAALIFTVVGESRSGVHASLRGP